MNDLTDEDRSEAPSGEPSLEGGAERRLVYCAQRRAAVALDECARCERSRGWVFDEGGGEGYVLCELDPAPKAPTPPPGSDSLSLALACPIRHLMTRAAVCARPDLSVRSLLAVLVERGLSGVPVIDRELRPVGFVSKTDVVRALHERSPGIGSADGAPCVGALMTPLCFSLAESTSLGRAAALLAFEGVHHAPVVDGDGRILGMLSSLDVLRHLAELDGHSV